MDDSVYTAIKLSLKNDQPILLPYSDQYYQSLRIWCDDCQGLRFWGQTSEGETWFVLLTEAA